MAHKFFYASDIHLEFNDLPDEDIPRGNNMILAGDIFTIPQLSRDNHRQRVLTFLENVSKKFDRVFFLTGNHEFYGAKIDDDQNLSEVLPKNFIHLYRGSSYDLDENTVIVGGTLWTDMKGADPGIMSLVGRGMNDFHYIYKPAGPASGRYSVFSTSDAVEIFRETFARIEKLVRDNSSKNIIVATHHAPSLKGVSNRYGSVNNPINFGYYTQLDAFIKANPQIKYWVHGHTHCQHKKKIGSTVLLSNARGYHTETGFHRFTMRKNFTVQ